MSKSGSYATSLMPVCLYLSPHCTGQQIHHRTYHWLPAEAVIVGCVPTLIMMALIGSQGSSVAITEVGLSDMDTTSPQQSEQPPLPAFGTGIEFRPKSKPDASQGPSASGASAAQASSADEIERADGSGSGSGVGSKSRGGSSGGLGISSGGGIRGARGSRGGALGSHLQGDEEVEDDQRGADDMDLGSPTAAAASATTAEAAGTVAAAAAAGGTGNAGPGPPRRRNYRKAAVESEQR